MPGSKKLLIPKLNISLGDFTDDTIYGLTFLQMADQVSDVISKVTLKQLDCGIHKYHLIEITSTMY